MFCPKCGNEIPDKSIFCPKCGQHIKHDSKEGTAPAAPSFTEKNGADSEHVSLFGSNPRYPKIALGAVAAVILVIVLLVSGLGRNDNADTPESGRSNEPISTGGKMDDPPETKEDPVKEKLAEADSAFGIGDYDTALRLYREIDTDYAQNRVRAIECIPVADAIAKEWLEKTDDPVANGIVLAAFNLDFTFDTEYDPQTYTFYTKMYYPSFYTDLATAFGTSRETIEEGVTSSGHEKAVYKMFCDRGYEDITCVSNMYDGDGELMASFPYDKATYKLDLEKERQAAVEEDRLQQEREQQRMEFVKDICSDADVFVTVQDKANHTLQANTHGKDWELSRAISQYIEEHQESWPQMSIINVEVVGEIEYGELWGTDNKESAEEEYIYYSVLPGRVVAHLPCTMPLYIKYQTETEYGDSEDAISCIAVCDMVYWVQPQTDPLNIQRVSTNLYTISSLEKTGTVQHFFKDEDFSNKECAILPNTNNYAQGYVGDIFESQFFDFAIESVSISCPSETRGGSIDVVATFYNYTEYAQPIYGTDLQIKWSENGPNEYDNLFYGDFIVEPQSTMSINFSYDFPIDGSTCYLTFTEYFSDGSTGATFDIDISPLICRAQQAKLWGRDFFY